jgi:RND family efflux transporter MFP subunit
MKPLERLSRSIGARGRTRAGIAIATLSILVLGGVLIERASSHVNRLALDSHPKGVTVVAARATRYRPSRRYVGTIEPWIEARIGPQLISAYVDTVLVRPGDRVTHGQVVATLDCRNASASSKAVAMQARAIQSEQEALAHEAARVAELREGGFASANEIENRAAQSASKGAQLMETEARIQRAALEVDDCVLRAPFTGEIAARMVDPGAFVHPGTTVAIVIDRRTVRVTAEVPEGDFAAVGRGTAVRVHALATGRDVAASIARRSPEADLSTRTVHIEIDVPDADCALPVGTTAEMAIDAGEARPAAELPLSAAAVRGTRATVFVVDGRTARKRVFDVLGEAGGTLYLDPSLRAGSRVVTEGRALLEDDDPVLAAFERPSPVAGAAPAVEANPAGATHTTQLSGAALAGAAP